MTHVHERLLFFIDIAQKFSQMWGLGEHSENSGGCDLKGGLNIQRGLYPG